MRVRPDQFPRPRIDEPPAGASGRKLAVLGGGCFWCTEAVYRGLEGVLAVVSGYSGDSAETADYRTVCSGSTDHAEVIQVVYDPARISFGALLRVFFSVAHDPTQVDRQGEDVGRQYRSVIFYVDEQQQRIARDYIRQLDEIGVFERPIATRLEPMTGFFEAEDYHQNYAELHPDQPFIAAVARPKVEKLRAYFGDALKSDAQ